MLAWSTDPQRTNGQTQTPPLDQQPFVVPVALPGDNLTPEKVMAFWCDGSRGLYIHPGIWHAGIFPVADEQGFLDRQGQVHARASADTGREFGVCLAGSLRPGGSKEL